MGSNDKNQVSINVFEQIDSICAEFRKQYRAGKRPDISAFLPKVNEQAQSVLFRNLISTEIRLRRQNGESPKSSDYLTRFPQFAKIIRQEFDESTMGSMDFNVDPGKGSNGTASELISDGSQTRTFEEPAASRLGDYELIRELGRGGFGVVYEARHIKQKNKVALKTLPTGSDGQEINADRLHKFRREFRTLSEINHPNLVGMQTLEFDGNQWFFTMDLIQGTDFLSYVRPKDWLDEKHLRSSLKQLAAGIMALHEKGIVHRDLKPSNVLVEPNGRVVILDFGLVAQLQQNTDMTATRSAMFAGTPRYAAPEQMFGERSEASDWYAMGVMLYEALTGAPPFPGRNPMEVLRQKQDEDPPSISASDGIPADLSTLADALIKRDPKQRLTTNQIAQQLQLDLESTKQQSAGSTDDEDIDLDAIPEEEIELIGREKQLAQLESAKQQLLETRKPVVCWITGLSGEGKSALAEKFLAPIRRGTEMLVLSGRCYDRESVPFKVIDSLIDSLVRFLRSLPEYEMEHFIPKDIEMFVRLFPLLRRVPALEHKGDVGNYDEHQVHNLAFAAFRDLLVNIGSRFPIVLFVDDLQWGDADSGDALIRILQPPDPPQVLFMGSVRKDEEEKSPFFATWNKNAPARPGAWLEQIIEVEPLTEKECLGYVQRRFPNSNIDPKEISALFSNSKGNPYFLEQLLEGFNQEQGSFQPIPIEQSIKRKLARCGSDANEVLDLIAVAGRSLPIKQIAEFLATSSTPSATITHMRSEKLVRLIGASDDQLVDTYHDKIREATNGQIDLQQKKKMHLRFADIFLAKQSIDGTENHLELAEQFGEQIFEIAHHLFEAGDTRAGKYQMSAAQIALDAYANENALEHLRKAEAIGLEDAKFVSSFDLNFMYGRAHFSSEDFENAVLRLEQSLVFAKRKVDRANANGLLAQIYFKKSDYILALKYFDTAFNELGQKLPKTNIGKLFASVVAVFRFHFLPKWADFLLRRRPQSELESLAELNNSQFLMMSQLDVYLLLYFSARACLLARHLERNRTRINSLAIYASICSFLGVNWLSRRLVHKAVQLEKNEANGVADLFNGWRQYCNGQLPEALSSIELGKERLKRTGEYFYMMCFHVEWHTWAIIGTSKHFIASARHEGIIASKSGDKLGMAYSFYGLAEGYAKNGNTDLAIQNGRGSVELLEPINSSFLCVAYNQLSRAQIQSGEYSNARITVSKSLKLIPKLRLVEISSPAFPLYVESVLESQWHSKSNSLAAKDIRKASRVAFIGRRVAWLFPNLRPHSFRVSARLCTAKGKTKKALKYFDKAIAAAEKIGARYEHARALIDKSMLDHPNAMTDRQRGLQMLEELSCVLPLAEQEYLGIEMPPYELDEECELESEVTV